jgi:hypothetical protein
MNLTQSLRTVSFFILSVTCTITLIAQAPDREFYQLKIYSFDNDMQVRITDDYLKDAYLPALKKLNIQNIGVFKLRPSIKDTIKKIFVLIPFKSLENFISLEENLLKDPLYLAKGSAYIKAAHNSPPYKRVESILLKAFKDMPVMRPSPLDGPRKERIYELRSYESATEEIFQNKVDMFNAGGEIDLFEKLNFNAVFYSEVISGPKMPNLMYMTTFSDQDNRDAHWKMFVDAPEWKAMSSMPKYQNNVSHIDIMYLYPTEYSDY